MFPQLHGSTLFLSSGVPGRRTTTYPHIAGASPTPLELSLRPLKAFPKLLTNSRARKSRLLEISFHESSLPLGMYASQFVKRELSPPLHPRSTTRPSDRHFLSFRPSQVPVPDISLRRREHPGFGKRNNPWLNLLNGNEVSVPLSTIRFGRGESG